MDTQLLLVRPRPREDELFSSWLVRLAWSNGEKLHVFCRRRLGIRRNLWNHDLDRLADLSSVERAAMVAGIPIERIFGTTLAAYEGALYERHVAKGVSRWLMPIGRYARTRTLHGQQYYARCLAEDEIPYFRRAWRLAFSVVCVKHGALLSDACHRCGAQVSFHEGDYGSWALREECPLVYCRKCKADLRETPVGWPVERGVLRFQERLHGALEHGWTELWPGRWVHSVPFFEGLHHLVRVLASNGYVRSIREVLMARRGELPFPTPFRDKAERFENLRVHDRYALIRLLAWLMDDWPWRFLRRVPRGACVEFVSSRLQALVAVLA